MNLSLRHIFTLLVGVFVCLSLFATHNRAGEITYKHVEGFTYEVTITTCTKSSVIADRPWLNINWGDSQAATDSLERMNIQELSGIDAQLNTYIGIHTYPGPGIYEISMQDPNRNGGVHNIPQSIDTPFCIVTELVINPAAGLNNSVLLLNPAKEQACLNKLWIHNPSAFDPDGDFLTYELVDCLGEGCAPINQFMQPDVSTDDFPDDVFSINEFTGDLTWDVPPLAGEFNCAIKITEWRLVAGEYVKVGSVLRDMQINVILCDNNPPVIEEIADTCVRIDDVLTLSMNAFDPDGDNVFYSAVGGPFQTDNFATFNAFTGDFSWQPDCEEVRLEPYFVQFKAEDNGFVELTDIESVAIRVIATRVENPTAEPAGNAIQLNWDPHECASDIPAVIHGQYSYKIYRKQGLYGFEPDYCETGVPEYTGYELVGEVEGLSNTSFLDSNGLGFGGEYCYMIVTCWPDGAESIASEEVCAVLVKDSPVLTNVSVENTDAASGENYIAWSPPTELDTTNWMGPYRYRLEWVNGGEIVYESSESPFLIWGDTIFSNHVGINTQDIQNVYRVQFYSDEQLVSSSISASSVFISLSPNDNQLEVAIDHQVPWSNYEYEIYLFDEDLGDFVLEDITTEQSYVIDSLQNNVEYCVQVLSRGSFNTDDIIDPIENWSQEVCGKPFDLTPPCPPDLNVDPDCIEIVNYIDWNNPNNFCADDVTSYNLYYTPVEGGEFVIWASFDFENDTTYVFNDFGDLNSIAGCFYVTALDSLLIGPEGVLTQNESLPSDTVCVDNCPIYFLPNVFSPNNDLINDQFIPFPYKFVESVDFRVFNRWGEEVFFTDDPDLNWDGTHKETGQILSDGVYYYVVTVNTIRLSGIVPEKISGHIQLLNGQNPISE